MRLTRFAEYSLRVILYLALRDDQTATINEVADGYGISEAHLRQVVANLVRSGYVSTTRGKGGGIRLATAPKDINVGALVRQMERNLEVVDCFAPLCPLVEICSLKPVLDDAVQDFFKRLDGYSLADLLEKKAAMAAAFT